MNQENFYLIPAEAINNAAGMGFNGCDKDGNELWDRYTNCNIKNIEVKLLEIL